MSKTDIDARQEFWSRGFVPLFNTYERARDILPCICSCGNRMEISLARMKLKKPNVIGRCKPCRHRIEPEAAARSMMDMRGMVMVGFLAEAEWKLWKKSRQDESTDLAPLNPSPICNSHPLWPEPKFIIPRTRVSFSCHCGNTETMKWKNILDGMKTPGCVCGNSQEDPANAIIEDPVENESEFSIEGNMSSVFFDGQPSYDVSANSNETEFRDYALPFLGFDANESWNDMMNMLIMQE